MLKKIPSLFIILALLFFGNSALAQESAEKSTEELRTDIASLINTIATLQGRFDTLQKSETETGNARGRAFTTDLSTGDTGVSVLRLQTVLNRDPETRLAMAGPGSPGHETKYYGVLTAKAVSSFQEKYSKKILEPLGLTQGTGYFGASTRTVLNSLITNLLPPHHTSDTDSSETPETSGELTVEQKIAYAISQLDGDGEFDDYDLESAPDDDISEGEQSEIYEASFEVEGGDLLLARIDYAVSGDTEEPWEYFKAVTLSVNDEEVRTQPVNEEKYWQEKDDITTRQAFGINVSNSGYELNPGDELWGSRFPKLYMPLEKDEEYTINIAFTAQENVDNVPMNWYMLIDDEGLRALTASNYNVYGGNEGVDGIEMFSLEEEGSDSELQLSTSGDNPDESTIAVDDDNTSDTFALTVGELEADNGEYEMEEVTAEFIVYDDGISTTTVEYEDVVSDLWIEIGDETFDADDVEDTADATSTVDVDGENGNDLIYEVTFDIDGDYTVDEDEEVNISVLAEFEAAEDNYDSGQEVSANIVRIEADGPDDVTLEDNVNGEEMTLSLFAIDSEEGDDDDSRDNTVTIAVTAAEDGEDVYIPTGTSATASSSAGFIYDEITGTPIVTITNTEDLDTDSTGAYYIISNGETVEFDINFQWTADGAATIESINYTDDDDQTPVLSLDDDVSYEVYDEND